MAQKTAFKGTPLTLLGRNLRLGVLAPQFKVLTGELREVTLDDFKGKIKVISVFPSIDTPVCDLQVKEFNNRAASLSTDVVVIGISKDLPFAQVRFCHDNSITKEVVLSDHKTSSFGINYGLLIKELNLLARAALIIDKSGLLRYLQVAPELSSPLNYDDVLKNLAEVIAKPLAVDKQELPERCKPCETGTPALPKDKVEKLIAQYRGWELVEDKKLVKEFKFKDFIEAKYFFDLLAVIAEEQGHHPNFSLVYNKLKVTLTTHSSGGLTENDFIMAKIIDEVGG